MVFEFKDLLGTSVDSASSRDKMANVYIGKTHYWQPVRQCSLHCIVAPVRQFLTFGAAVRAPGARTRPNAAPSTWCGSFMTKDRN